MFMFVQGHTDASQKWGEMVEEFVFKELGLVANQADPCTYSGLYEGQPVILCRATDDFLLFCRDKSTYNKMIILFRVKWTVHALDNIKLFFGIRFICSPHCVTLVQTHKAKQITIDVFGQSYNRQQLSGQGHATPMISGTENANELAACPPFSPAELKTVQTGETFGFGFCHVLGACMHCALWTWLDILTACLVLAQYQAAPGLLRFRALKHLVGYLCLHPDLPMTFNQATTARDVSAIDFKLLSLDAKEHHVGSAFVEVIPSNHNPSHDLDPNGFTSCDNLFQSFDPTEKVNIAAILVEVNRLAPPVTEWLVDANLPGGLYKRMATTGGSVEMGGTTVIQIASKQTTMAHNSTEAELDAASFLGKILRWLVLFMSNLGLPFQGPIPIAEDNAATQIIAHAGKIMCNVPHVAM
jgi:hypothetical protein